MVILAGPSLQTHVRSHRLTGGLVCLLYRLALRVAIFEFLLELRRMMSEALSGGQLPSSIAVQSGGMHPH